MFPPQTSFSSVLSAIHHRVMYKLCECTKGHITDKLPVLFLFSVTYHVFPSQTYIKRFQNDMRKKKLKKKPMTHPLLPLWLFPPNLKHAP